MLVISRVAFHASKQQFFVMLSIKFNGNGLNTRCSVLEYYLNYNYMIDTYLHVEGSVGHGVYKVKLRQPGQGSLHSA